MQCFLRFEFPFELVYRVQIANYIPSDEDLNYPAKLEQLAEKKSETTSCHYFCCFNALCIYTLESILFLGFAFSSVFTRCYMGLAKGDGIGLHANEFQFITWCPPLEKTPSSLSFKVVPKFRTSSVHWFGQETVEVCSVSILNQRVDSIMGKLLKEQAFATPDKVVELVQKVKTQPFSKCCLR
ncbi:hypothetical protein Q3G72_000816 [Acer saccharum]|nr:hypothetical protein Q3G72_000816 [Acer saccharum]